MRYAVVPPGASIEASLSGSPDDVSRASIRVEATPEDGDDLELIEHIDITLHRSITIRPGDVTPIALDTQDWEVGHIGGGTFRASPRHPIGRRSWTFLFEDVPVPHHGGPNDEPVGDEPTVAYGILEVAETLRTGPSEPERLEIRKVSPRLRIDHFNLVGSGAATRQSPGSARLAWATTGAQSVRLYGPDGEINLGVAARDARDNTQHIQVETTGTYTLIAVRPGHGHALAQTTVTVQDLTAVRHLAVGQRVDGDLRVNGTLRTDRVVVTEKVLGGSWMDPEVDENRQGEIQAVGLDAERIEVTGEPQLLRPSTVRTARLSVPGFVQAPPESDGDIIDVHDIVRAGTLSVHNRILTSAVVVDSEAVQIGDWLLEVDADHGSGAEPAGDRGEGETAPDASDAAVRDDDNDRDLILWYAPDGERTASIRFSARPEGVD